MPIKIKGLKTSPSQQGLGITTSGKLYPKEGGGGADPDYGIAWIPIVPNGDTTDETSQTMVAAKYHKTVNENDTAFGTLKKKVPHTPYPWLFVGKIFDERAKEADYRIKWRATWNGRPIEIAEEGRDFMAPDRSDPGWSALARKNSQELKSFLPNRTKHTVGVGKTDNPPVVGAFRRYVFVYPNTVTEDLGIVWTGVFQDADTRSGFRERMPGYDEVSSDPPTESGYGWYTVNGPGPKPPDVDYYANVFQQSSSKIGLGELELEATIYDSVLPSAKKLATHKLWLNVDEEDTVTYVYVPLYILKFVGDEGQHSDESYYSFRNFLDPSKWAETIEIQHWKMPLNWNLIADTEGWEALFDKSIRIYRSKAQQMIGPEVFAPLPTVPWGPVGPAGVEGYAFEYESGGDPEAKERYRRTGDLVVANTVWDEQTNSTWVWDGERAEVIDADLNHDLLVFRTSAWHVLPALNPAIQSNVPFCLVHVVATNRPIEPPGPLNYSKFIPKFYLKSKAQSSFPTWESRWPENDLNDYWFYFRDGKPLWGLEVVMEGWFLPDNWESLLNLGHPAQEDLLGNRTVWDIGEKATVQEMINLMGGGFDIDILTYIPWSYRGTDALHGVCYAGSYTDLYDTKITYTLTGGFFFGPHNASDPTGDGNWHLEPDPYYPGYDTIVFDNPPSTISYMFGTQNIFDDHHVMRDHLLETFDPVLKNVSDKCVMNLDWYDGEPTPLDGLVPIVSADVSHQIIENMVLLLFQPAQDLRCATTTVEGLVKVSSFHSTQIRITHLTVYHPTTHCGTRGLFECGWVDNSQYPIYNFNLSMPEAPPYILNFGYWSDEYPCAPATGIDPSSLTGTDDYGNPITPSVTDFDLTDAPLYLENTDGGVWVYGAYPVGIPYIRTEVLEPFLPTLYNFVIKATIEVVRYDSDSDEWIVVESIAKPWWIVHGACV